MFEGIITSEFKSIFKDAIYALLEDTALTVKCELVYGGTKWTDCSNCQFNLSTGRSLNDSCLVCGGAGRLEVTDTDTIYLAVLWDYKKWLPLATNISTPEGYIQTLSKIDTITKLKKCKYLIPNQGIESYVHHKFVREGEPNPMGFGDDAFIATMWKRT